MLANLRSQPYSPQRAATERTALGVIIEKADLEYAKRVIEPIASIPTPAVDLNFAIYLAAEHGNIAVLKLLLDNGVDIKRRNDDGNTILTLAAGAGHEAVVRLLLEKGADIEQRTYGDTTLTLAAEAGHEAVVRLLLENGADIKQRNYDGDTALTLAAEAGHEVVVGLLLEKGADIEQRNDDGNTALTLAAEAGHETVVRLLPKKGADKVDKRITSGKQSESGTTSSGTIEASRPYRRRLLLFGDSSLVRTMRKSRSALIEAVKHGHEAMVVQSLEHISFKYSERRTLRSALIEAAKHGHEAVVAQLLKVPLFMYSERRALCSALIEAAKQGHETVVMHILRRYDRVINYTTISRSLFMAAQNGHCRVVDALLTGHQLSNSAFVANGFDKYGRTLLHWAIESGDEKNVLQLIKAGASVAFLDDCGMSPLQLAAINGVSPLKLDAARVYLTEKNSPADGRHSLCAKMELGLGFGDLHLTMASRIIQSSSDTYNSPPYNEGISLYDFILHGIVRSLGSPAPFEILSNPTYTSLLPSWGSSLIGMHIRFAIGNNTSVIVRADRLFGFGSELDGLRFLQALIAFEESIHEETNRFRLRQAMRASNPKHHASLRGHQLLIWFVALAHSASKHQEQRLKAIQNRNGSPIPVGSCWRDAFGDVLEVDLHDHFYPFDTICLNPTIWPENRDSRVSFSNGLTFSTIEDLASAMGIYSKATLDGMVFWRGSRGICVLVGILPYKNIPFWHVCTIEQSSYLEADPESFVRSIKSSRDSILEVNSRLQCLRDCHEATSFEGTILVGALVEPGWCDKVDCDGLFQAHGGNIQAGRLAPEGRRQGLHWSNITGQLQLSMGAQGPQGSVTLGGEMARSNGYELLMAENSLAHSLTILERALRSWVLVYQSSNGQVVQQNLYCIVSCFLTVSLMFRGI
jgi:ankyrin repeat protein